MYSHAKVAKSLEEHKRNYEQMKAQEAAASSQQEYIAGSQSRGQKVRVPRIMLCMLCPWLVFAPSAMHRDAMITSVLHAHCI